MIQASSTIKKVTLELGGKSPNLILDDADFDIAIDGSLWATFMHNGQACESGTRLLVPASIYDEFVPRLIDRASRLKVGLAGDGETDLGPLISAGQLRSVEEYIKLGIEEGATPALLGQRVDDPNLAGRPLYHADDLYRRGQQHAHRPGGDLWAGVMRHQV